MADGRDEDRTARLEHQLAAAQQITHIGSWEWELATNALTWSDELYRIYGLEPKSCELSFEGFLSRVHPDDRERIQKNVRDAMQRGGRFAYRERIVRPNGDIRHLDTIGEVRTDAEARVVGLIGTCRDVTDERLARRMREAEQEVLESIATGARLDDVLDRIVLLIEEQSPPTIGSIVLLDSTGTRLAKVAAPNLPDAYNRALEGLPIGPMAGSCGTSAFTKQAVFVTDIETDARWEPYRDIAKNANLRACWSTPIFAGDGRVLGTFALYFREPRSPAQAEIELIGRATYMAGIAIERAHADEMLRALTARVEEVREDERKSMAREIHDELGQMLTALKLDIAWLQHRKTFDDATNARLDEMSELTAALIDTVRRISAELRPGVLDLGLVAAIEWQAEEFERRTETTCIVNADPSIEVSTTTATALFRILQEALTNVARHAKASLVEITVERHDGLLRLTVRDDGKGIPPEAVAGRTSLGLLGLSERAARLGGHVAITGAPGEGTRVVVEVPS